MRADRRAGATAVSIAGITIAGATALGVAYSDSFERELLLVVIGLVCAIPALVRLAQGKFDPFEPIFVISAAIVVLFMIRPAAHLIYESPIYLGWDVRPGFDRTLFIALVGTLAVYGGYITGAGGHLADRIPTPPARWSVAAAVRFSVLMLLLAIVLIAALLNTVGTESATSLLGGRSTQQDSFLRETTAYFYFAPVLMVPVTLLLYETSNMHRSTTLLVSSVISGAAFVTLLAPRGDRLWLLTLLGALAVLPYLRRGTRPRVLTMALVAGLVFLIGISFLRSYRTYEDRSGPASQVLGTTIAQPGQAVKEFLLGPDTEMFPFLSLLVQTVPEHTGHQPGATVASLLTQPIPSVLYSDKPLSADSLIYRELLPARAVASRAGPAPSMFGGFYFDAGIPGVLIGCFLVGVAARTLFEYLRRNPANAAVRLLFASSLPLVLIMVRGNPTDTLARATYTILPLVGFFWVTSLLGARRPRQSSPRPFRLGGGGGMHEGQESR